MEESKIIVLKKETITRLLKDVKQIIKNPLTDNGIYYQHDMEDMLKGYAMIVGPEDTPYFGGFYFFEFKFPCDYPHSPPVVKYCTNGDNIRFNPNLYKCGKVCISLLNTWSGDQWTSCQTISSVLLNLCMLLCKDPLLNEPGLHQKDEQCEDYSTIIYYKNIEVAFLQMYIKKQGVFLEKFEIFYPILVEQFHKNAEKILKDLEEKKDLPIRVAKTNYYAMNILIDYNRLIKDFHNIYDSIKK